MPYIDELTVFINVKIETLKEFSKETPKIVKIEERKRSEIIKIIIDKKYLFIINLSKLVSEKNCLFIDTFFGLTWDIKLFKENLNSTYNLINLIPELVEKKEPPIITKIKKINDKLFGVLFKEKPIFEILLDILNSSKLISYSKLKKEKKINIRNNK